MTTDTPTPKKNTLLRRALRGARHGSRIALSALVFAGTFAVYAAIFAVVGGALLWLGAREHLTLSECIAIVMVLVLGVTLVRQTVLYVTSALDVASFLSDLVMYGMKPVNDYDSEKRRARDAFDDGLRSIDEHRPMTTEYRPPATSPGTLEVHVSNPAVATSEDLLAQVAKEVAFLNRGRDVSSSTTAANAVSAETIKADTVTEGKIVAGVALSEPDRRDDDGSAIPVSTS
ncbi:hypothetical protein ACFCZ3_19785 [Cellulosimicrobium cellulans]|uniref:hypothetical protein n=1 Tax=Cellulosimicrobium cellulans TaxID=1710 RepID=UPI0035E383A3